MLAQPPRRCRCGAARDRRGQDRLSRPKCSSSTCGSIPISASIRSSGSRFSPPIHDRLPEAPAAGPEQLGALGTLREIVAFLSAAVVEPIVNQAGSTIASTATDDRADEPVARVLLEAVADKTGYPIEMLELDMQLDTDLGIDSIKRVEILSAVQERLPRAGSISPEQLGSLASLRQIVTALSDTPADVPVSSAKFQNGQPGGIININGSPSSRRACADADRHHSENGTASPHRASALRELHPVIRGLQNAETREQLRLRAGGTVWVTSDGTPLTEAVCAALRKRDLLVQVIRLARFDRSRA